MMPGNHEMNKGVYLVLVGKSTKEDTLVAIWRSLAGGLLSLRTGTNQFLQMGSDIKTGLN